MQINGNTLAAFGGGLVIGIGVGIAAEIAYEKWQDRKYAESIESDVVINEETDDEEEDSPADTDGDVVLGDGTEQPSTKSDILKDEYDLEKRQYSRLYREKRGEYFDEEDRDERDLEELAKEVYDEDDLYNEYSHFKDDEHERSQPQVITEAEFAAHGNGYSKVHCTYAEDESGVWILTNDDQNNQEMDIKNTIGEAALGYFKHEEGLEEDESVCYVRNDFLGVDYCVMKYPYME